MGKQWTESSAKMYLTNQGGEHVSLRFIMKTGGWSGLKACSAMDFLKNKCGYKFYMRKAATK